MECWILALPLLILILLLLAVVLACFKRWKWAVGVRVVAFIVNGYGEVFALHPLGGCSSETGERLTVMTFNVHGPGEDFDKRIAGIAELIREENPDVVFPREKWDWVSDLVQIVLFYEVYKRRHNNHNGALKF